MAVVIRRFADGAVTNEQDDTFEFRMVEAGGAAFGDPLNPVLRLAIPRGHVGGTFVETPGRIGPWQAPNGDLYFIMEPAETDNVFMMMKSTDKGPPGERSTERTAPRPRISNRSMPGRWATRFISSIRSPGRAGITRSALPTTQPSPIHGPSATNCGLRTSVAQAATLAVRSDGSVVAFYVGQTIHYSIRSPAGTWGQTPSSIGVGPTGRPQAVLGAKDTVHVAYYGTDGTIWYRRLLPTAR